MENSEQLAGIQQKEQGTHSTFKYLELIDKIGEEKLKQIESMMTDRIMNIVIVDLNGREIPLGVSKCLFIFRLSN